MLGMTTRRLRLGPVFLGGAVAALLTACGQGQAPAQAAGQAPGAPITGVPAGVSSGVFGHDWRSLPAGMTAQALSGDTLLSALNPKTSSNGWGPWERDRSNGEQGGTDGQPIRLRGQSFARGLGVHSESELIYSLDGRCSVFTAQVGIDDEVGPRGSVVFQVYADGAKLYDSGVLTGSSAAQPVSVNLNGKQELRLVVGNAGDNYDYDHADWADAKLSCGPERGLKGEYYNDRAFGTLALTRTDPDVNFDWGEGSPAQGIGADQFSVRWTGQLKAPASGTYTFTTVSDDGVRLWVNGKAVVDNWTIHPKTRDSGQITLEAGKSYDLKMEYFEQGGLAEARLLWQPPGQAETGVPQDALTPVSGPTTPPPNPGNGSVRFPDTVEGLVNLTAAPYNAVGDGATDNTARIQAALDDHASDRSILYLPPGKYLVSDSLRWPLTTRSGQTAYGLETLQGSGADSTVLLLKSGSFNDPAAGKAVIDMGKHGSADYFFNAVRDLTIDTGSGNPGATGLKFFSNNQGTVKNVVIRSGAGGVTGLDLGYTGQNGPLLIKNVKIVGFAQGVSMGDAVNSQTFEHLSLQGQSKVGLVNTGQAASIRGLESVNSVPAVINTGGVMTLVDAKLTGGAGGAAITNGDVLYARNVQTAGYSTAIASTVSGAPSEAGPNVKEYVSSAALSLFPSPPSSLNLPVKETPDVPQDDPASWASVRTYGAAADGRDDSAAIQAAIDSGATTVYFPAGGYGLDSTVSIRGNVRRLIGFGAFFRMRTPAGTPAFRFVDGAAPVVVFERFSILELGAEFLEHAASRTLVLKNADIGRIEKGGYRGVGSGDMFFEDVASGPITMGRQNVWARQLNVENQGTHILNNGGNLWILGYKTERGGTLIDTRAGGHTELLGGLSYTTTAGSLAPMFVNSASSLSLSFTEVAYNRDPYTVLIQETRGGETKTLRRGDAPLRPDFLVGSVLPLYTGAAPTP